MPVGLRARNGPKRIYFTAIDIAFGCDHLFKCV